MIFIWKMNILKKLKENKNKKNYFLRNIRRVPQMAHVAWSVLIEFDRILDICYPLKYLLVKLSVYGHQKYTITESRMQHMLINLKFNINIPQHAKH